MKKLVLFFLFSIAPFLAKGSIIDILETTDNSFKLQNELKTDIGSVFSGIKPVSFIQAFESKNFESALEVWLKSIQGSFFSKSATGSALYAYLLFQNGFEAIALNQLFQNSQPDKINPIVRNLWKLNIDKSNSVWNYFYFPLSSNWSLFFSPEMVFKIGSKSPFHIVKDRDYIKSLLSLPVKDKLDTFSLEWLFVLSFIQQNDMDSATKILSWLLSQTKDSYRKDKINLTVARLLADIEENKHALTYYQKIKRLSYFWFLAQEEIILLNLNNGDNSQAYSKAMAFNYPSFLKELSPSMFFALSLAQLKNCDNRGATQSLIAFKKAFFKPYKELIKNRNEKQYKDLILDLLGFYQSKSLYYNIGKTHLFYHLRKDSRLKNDLLFYNYIKEKRKSRKVKFNKLLLKEDKMILDLKNKIYSRIQFLLKQEIASIERVLKNFHLLEAEILYREYSNQASLDFSHTNFWYKDISFYRPSHFIYFPFNREEIWLDELTDYKTSQNNKCPKGTEVL